MTIIEFFVCFIVGYYVGWRVREIHAKRTMMKTLAMMEKAMEESQVDIVDIEIREHASQFYIYNKDTQEFLAQGTNREELIERLNHRFPRTTFMADRDDIAKVKPTHESV